MNVGRLVIAVVVFAAVSEAWAAFLGVELQPGSGSGMPEVSIRAVAPGSPAAAAGLQPGDVILSIQGQPVTMPEEVVDLVRAAAPGSQIEMEVLRGSKAVRLRITLGDAPAAASMPPGSPSMGAGMTPLARGNLGLSPGGVAVTAKQSAHCSALAPADWAFQSNANASTVEALSADRRMYAGWGVAGINRAQERYYGPFYGPPETSIQFLAQQIAQGSLGDPSPIRYVSPPQAFLGYFTLRRVESAGTQGFVFFHIYPGAAGPGTYVESVYFALANKTLGPAGVAVASGVAVSLRCVTQLVPTRNDPPRAGKDKGRKPVACGQAEGNLKGYNKELGVQWAHTALGTNILMDATTAYENGPDGPGWYVQNGNFKEKLQLGRSDDC